MAKKTIWDLSLNIAGKGTEASQAIRTVKKQLEDLKAAADQVGKDWKDFAGNASKLALGFAGGVAAATAGVVSMANSFAEAGDKAAKTSAALGIGIEAYQELTYAMGQSGVSAQEFDSALQKFNLTVRQGAAGNEAMQKQLEAVGLSARKLAGMKPEQALERLSDYMQTLPNDAERTRVAVTLFGKTAGPKMMAAMAQGSEGLKQLSQEARDLGIVISDEQAKQSEAYGDAMDRLKQSVTGMKNQFIGSAIGPLTEAFDHLKGAIVEQMPVIREVGKAFGQWLGDLVKRMPEIIAKIKEFGSWVKNTVTGVKDFVGGWKNLAKILAGLAIAPTFISGLKLVWSLGNFIKVAIGAIGPILGGLSGGFTAMAAAALPVIGIIAGIAAVIYTVVKNFDNLKQYALDCIERIKSAFVGATGGMAVDWQKVGETAKTVLGIIMSILEGGVLLAIKTVMNAITSGIQFVIGAFKALWNVAKLIFWPIETIVKVIIGLFTDGWSGAMDAVGGQFTKLGEIFKGIFGGIKTMISAVAGFFKGQFKNAIEFIDKIFGNGEFFNGIWSGVKDAAGKAWDGMKNAGNRAIENMKRSWFALKDNAGNVWNSIKEKAGGFMNWLRGKTPALVGQLKGAWQSFSGFFGGLWESMKQGPGTTVDYIKNSFSGLFTNSKDRFFGMINTVKGFFQQINEFVNNFIGGLPGPFQKVFAGIKIVIDGFIGFWKNAFSSAINAIKNIVALLPNLFSDPIGTIKAIIGEIGGFFRNVFQGAVNAVKGIIDSLAEKFGGVFASIKEKIEGFVNFFKSKFEGVKNFFGGIGNAIGGVFGGRDTAVPGHASGGIFTQPHIAQIAEQGAEAVVPLNNSPGGFDTWKQAGEMGGYMKTASEQSQAIAAAAPVTAAAPGAKTPEPSPVMDAASQKISSGDTTVRVDFKMTNNFNGGTPDGETVTQISEAGQKAGEDFEAKVASVFDALMRDRRRVSYA